MGARLALAHWALNAAAGVTTNVNLGGNETLNGLSANVDPAGTANLSVSGGDTLTVNTNGPTQLTGAITIGGGGHALWSTATKSTLQVSRHVEHCRQHDREIWRWASANSGNSSVGTGVVVTVASGATLELAGTTSALTDPTGVSGNVTGSAYQRAAVQVDGTLLVDAGANQEVGGIDPVSGTSGSVVLADNSGSGTSNLTADHINLNSLVIG